MKPILLFDIDGTLLHVKRKFLNGVIDKILAELDISREILDGMSFAGRTDKDIFIELVSSQEEKAGLFEAVKKMYVAEMQKQLSEQQLDIIDGAKKAVQFAVENKLEIGLCTGNFKEVAVAKVEAAGFYDLFHFGGYGCHHKDRAYLPGEASRQHHRLTNRKTEPEQYIVIGDTPNDIRCAKAFGAKSVAVTTGGFSRSDLEMFEPDIVVDNLGNIDSWIENFL